jgi:hypothetical protein
MSRLLKCIIAIAHGEMTFWSVQAEDRKHGNQIWPVLINDEKYS